MASNRIVMPTRASPSNGGKIRAGILLVALLLIASALLLAAVPRRPSPGHAGQPLYYGINLASGSFAADRLPGVYAKDYIYPTRATGAPFVAIGMNTVRVPFIWERVQPTAMGPLNPDELGRLDRTIDELGQFSLIILDLHNYGYYHGKTLDQSPASAGQLADVWQKLAVHYGGNPHVAFGIMNEPNKMEAAQWRSILDRTVPAIRRTGAHNLLLIPGVRWTGGHSWFDGGSDSNAANLSSFRDPGNHFLFEIHQYLDSDSSGTGTNCVSPTIGRERLAAVTTWLRERKAGALLGEFGAARSPECVRALDDLIGFMDENADVWRAWTYWTAGDWWGDYPQSIQPEGGVAKPQTAVLAQHIRRYRKL